MVQGLLLDRIDAKPAGAPVGREHDAIVRAHAHETQAALTFAQFALARTDVALYAAVR